MLKYPLKPKLQKLNIHLFLKECAELTYFRGDSSLKNGAFFYSYPRAVIHNLFVWNKQLFDFWELKDVFMLFFQSVFQVDEKSKYRLSNIVEILSKFGQILSNSVKILSNFDQILSILSKCGQI